MIVQDLCQSFLEKHTTDAARSVEKTKLTDAAGLLAEMPTSTVASAIGQMNPMLACDLLSQLPEENQAELVSILDAGKAVPIFRRMNPAARDEVFKLLPPEKRDLLKQLLNYPENTAGAKLDPCYPCVAEDLTLAEALSQVKESDDQHAVYWFTIDREHVLTGVISIRDLLSPDAGKRLREVRRDCSSRVSAYSDIVHIPMTREIIQQSAIPVVDERNVFLGAVRLESLADVSSLAELNDSLQVAGSALGELYRMGLFGLFHSLDPGERSNPAMGGTRS